MKTKQEIIESLQEHKAELQQRFGIEGLALFGSFADGTHNERSDVDILVLKMQQKNAFVLLRAKRFLSENLGLNVDLGLFDSLRPFIRKRVEKEMICV